MPKLSLAYTAGVVTPRSNNSSKVNLALPPAESSNSDSNEKEEEGNKESSEPDEVEAKAIRMATRQSSSSSPKEGPLRYEDIIKNAIRAPPPPPSPKETKKGMGFSLVRRKSGKGRAPPAQITI